MQIRHSNHSEQSKTSCIQSADQAPPVVIVKRGEASTAEPLRSTKRLNNPITQMKKRNGANPCEKIAQSNASHEYIDNRYC